MGNKSGPRNIGPEKFLNIWATGEAKELAPAMLREASRQITEMENWMKEQVKYDPWMMADEYELTLFPLIKKAKKYRYKIYNHTKSIKEAKEKILVICGKKYGGNEGDPAFWSDPDVVALETEIADLEHDQMGYVWRIKKIHTHVKKTAHIQLAPGEVDPFAEYEYDPAKS